MSVKEDTDLVGRLSDFVGNREYQAVRDNFNFAGEARRGHLKERFLTSGALLLSDSWTFGKAISLWR
jgi:hypothetical protein